MNEKLILQFREKYPKKMINYLNEKNEKYGGEYLKFNLEILEEILKETTLDYQIKPDSVSIKGDCKLLSRFLWECTVVADFDETRNELYLYPYVTATDVMRACCAIIKIFGKNA